MGLKIDIVTIFPEYFEPLKISLLGKAIENHIITVNLINPRDFTTDLHKSVDDTPFGGGAGMIMKPDILKKAIDSVITKGSKLLITSPLGEIFSQKQATDLSKEKHLILVCGRYEGIDDRLILHYQENGYDAQYISIGKFVLFGGEVATLAIIEAISRLVPKVLGNKESIIQESFSDEKTLEYPQYTRPEVFEGIEVPSVLKSGNHKLIEQWRKENRK